jgi:hypothetical protein
MEIEREEIRQQMLKMLPNVSRYHDDPQGFSQERLEAIQPTIVGVPEDGGYFDESSLIFQEYDSQGGLFLNGTIYDEGGYVNVREVKPSSAYPIGVHKGINILGYDPKNASPFGSYVYRTQPFPGDVDLSEEVKIKGSLEHAINIFEIKLREIINKINDSRGIYLGDVKIGLDKRFDVNIGIWEDGVIYDYKPARIIKDIGMLPMNSNDYKDICKLLKNTITHDEWDDVYNILRKYYVLRWKSNEILQGFKILPGNVKKSLHDALMDKSMVKVDMWIPINDRYIEMTNFFILEYGKRKDEYKLINLPQNFKEKAPEQLKEEVEKLAFSPSLFKPFKLAKRMWSISRSRDLLRPLTALTPLMRSDASRLSQINSEIETIMLILGHVKNPPHASLMKQIDGFKDRLTNVVDFNISLEQLDNINAAIDHINRGDKFNKDKTIDILSQIQSFLKSKINSYTIEYFQINNLWPVPHIFLPNIPSHNINRVPDSILSLIRKYNQMAAIPNPIHFK